MGEGSQAREKAKRGGLGVLSRKHSGLMKWQVDEIKRAEKGMYLASKATFIQYMVDTACITLNNLGWGKDRIDTFMTEWGRVFDEFHEALEETVETDYVRAKFDARVKPICPEKDYKPFEDRYNYLPQIKY